MSASRRGRGSSNPHRRDRGTAQSGALSRI